jgi:hypothetical protein
MIVGRIAMRPYNDQLFGEVVLVGANCQFAPTTDARGV